MKIEFLTRRSSARARFLAVGALLALTSLSVNVAAQQQLSKRYPAAKNVRIELRNTSGTITVESWNKNEIRLTATIESKKAQVLPRQTEQSLVVDVMGDNRGRGDHFGVEQCTRAQQPQEVAAVPVRVVHHGCNAATAV